MNFALLGTADLTARVCFIVFMRLYRSRRKLLTIVTFFALGVTCLTVSLLLKLTTQTGLIVPLFIIGKFLASITSTTSFLLLVESFPADCRLLGMIKHLTKYNCFRWNVMPGHLPWISPGNSFPGANKLGRLQVGCPRNFWHYGICFVIFGRVSP